GRGGAPRRSPLTGDPFIYSLPRGCGPPGPDGTCARSPSRPRVERVDVKQYSRAARRRQSLPETIRPPPPPSYGEHLLAAKAVDYVLDHLDPEPGAGGRVDPAVDVLERLGDEVVLHRVPERLELDGLAGGRAERDREPRGGHDRRRPRGRVRLPPVRLDAVADLLETGDPLGAAGIDTDDVDGVSREDALEALECPLLLAVREPRRRLRAKVRVPLRVPRSQRLLDPRQLVRLHVAHAAAGGGDVPPDRDGAVDHQHLVEPDPLAHRAHVVDVAIVLVPEPCVSALAETGLHALQAGGQPLLRLLDHLRDRFVMGVTGRDRRQPLVHGPTEQVEDARAVRLPFQVPEGDVDRGDGVRRDAASVAVPPRVVLVPAPERLDMRRVLADQVLGHPLDHRLRGEV